MPDFDWKGIRNKQYVSGTVSALTRDEAAHKLKIDGIIITQLAKRLREAEKEIKERRNWRENVSFRHGPSRHYRWTCLWEGCFASGRRRHAPEDRDREGEFFFRWPPTQRSCRRLRIRNALEGPHISSRPASALDPSCFRRDDQCGVGVHRNRSLNSISQPGRLRSRSSGVCAAFASTF